MGEKLRVAFVGAGFMAQAVHIPNFLALQEVEAVALAEARPKLRELVARHFGIPRAVAHHEQVAEMDDVDAAVVIMREAWHPKVAIDLLQAGKHVFIEKPLAPSSAVGAEMVRAAEECGRLLMVGYMKRYDDGVRLAGRLFGSLIEGGELGRLTMARLHCFGGDWVCGLRAPISTDESLPELQAAPVWDGVPERMRPDFAIFVNVYCHNLNLLRFFLGDQVECLAARWDEKAKVALLDAGGVPVTAEFGQMAAHAWDESTVFYFEQGMMEILTPPPLLRNVSARVVLYRGGQRRELDEHLPQWTWAFANEARAFVEACLGRGESLSPASDALKDLELAERIAQCAVSGRQC